MTADGFEGCVERGPGSTAGLELMSLGQAAREYATSQPLGKALWGEPCWPIKAPVIQAVCHPPPPTIKPASLLQSLVLQMALEPNQSQTPPWPLPLPRSGYSLWPSWLPAPLTASSLAPFLFPVSLFCGAFTTPVPQMRVT